MSTSIDFLCRRENFCQLTKQAGDLPSASVNFRATGRTSINSRHISMRPADLSLTSVNFSYFQKSFRQFSSTLVQPGDPTLATVNVPCGWETFCQLPLSFHAAWGLSVTFCHLSVQPGDLWLNFCVAGRHSFNYHQLSVWLGDLPSTSVNVQDGQVTLCLIWSTFLAAGRPSVKFRQLFVQLGDLPSTSVKFPCGRRLSVNFH